MKLFDYIPKYEQCPLCDGNLQLIQPAFGESNYYCNYETYYNHEHFFYLPKSSWARAIIDNYIICIEENETRIHESDNMQMLHLTPFIRYNKALDLSDPNLLSFIQNLLVIS